jgi:hypothetical protein
MPYFTLDAETVLLLLRAALAQLLDALHRWLLALVDPWDPGAMSAARTAEIAADRPRSLGVIRDQSPGPTARDRATAARPGAPHLTAGTTRPGRAIDG